MKVKFPVIFISLCFIASCSSTSHNNTGEKAALLLVAVPAIIIASPFLAVEAVSNSSYQPLKKGSSIDETIKSFGYPAFQYKCNNGKILFEYEKSIKGLKKRFFLFNENQEFIKATNSPEESCTIKNT
ncbi:hypothetical protein [Cellvibrio sp. KY-YJ-3]|uniref:hypothetical protein n=1 Tax=Cellvibrio sp. KY-YJ-3 TaxID=454662 RepID=UPI0012470B42|nr:hypothetical protein [Cellvibrio sp. KY-YJ-3]QEY12646.1 hypothetical protein D0B88_10530 [Cellvibrio sp. KY-YJ-3]